MTKTLDQYFADWEGSAFGFGYGTGEPHVLAALKAFFGAFGVDNDGMFLGSQIFAPEYRPTSYDHEKLEAALTPTVAWLLINALCRNPSVIEYGTSPRFGWLTPSGERLKAFVDAHTVEDLIAICCERPEDDMPCYPDACNCGPNGYEKGRICDNPFWLRK